VYKRAKKLIWMNSTNKEYISSPTALYNVYKKRLIIMLSVNFTISI